MTAIRKMQHNSKRRLLIGLAMTAAVLPFSAAVQADDFVANLERVLRDHQLMRMVDADVATAREQVSVERAAWFPKLTVGAAVGRQEIDRDVGSNGNFNPSHSSVALNQLVTDFGHTSARVAAARSIADKENVERELQRQNLVLAAIEAQLQLIQASRSLQFAEASENNIKHQTSLESARLEAGRGYATDVLQAKAQLAGAEARRVAARSRLLQALNRYRAVFGDEPLDPAGLQALAIPEALLPSTEASILDAIAQANPDVAAALSRLEVTRAERDVVRARELMPRVSVQLGQYFYDEHDGVLGNRDDVRATLNFDWSFDLGMKAFSVTRAADYSIASAQEKADYVRIQALEEGRNALAGWHTSRERSAHLTNQVDIAGRFLELARKEREMGRRSLLDILNGEIALINAQSDATAARIDEVIASYRLLRAVGGLSMETLNAHVVPAEQLLSAVVETTVSSR